MAVASTFIPGLHPQNPHYIPGYTGHCPLLRFSMGQTYGHMTGQLLRGAPGLAWPPARRILLPPIQPPRSPEVPRGSPAVRRGHKRLSSSMIPGYTGFVPQAQFIFAKNCSQVWAEALNDFTHWCGEQGEQELPKEVKGEDVEKDQEPQPKSQLEEEEPELGQEVGQAVWQEWGASPLLPPIPWMTEILTSSSCQALQEFGQMYSQGKPQMGLKHLPALSRTYPQNLGLLPNYGGYVPGYKFQFGRTYGHLTHDALGLSTFQKQVVA
ncbi:ciliary microtubule inner protein 2B isoform X7 [Desmodus rotundus]|uniref:ciliary microtubule inner protein 2B isoform X7 n=1 Tax=Desmodus rotundus TaxID=9430 RepID=UPI002380F0A2|nr:protein FAM166B isoform X7 [Desmodus rotundus]